MSTPSPWTVDHIGIAVSDIDAAIALYASTAGTSVTLREKLVDRGVELAFLNTGGTKLELLMPLRDDTPIAKFLAKRGPGLHHVCYKVDNIRQEMERLKQPLWWERRLTLLELGIERLHRPLWRER